jgi:hypothetical protein
MRGDFKEWYRECFAKNWPLGQGKTGREGGRKGLDAENIETEAERVRRN